MIIPLLLATLAAILYASSIHIDKYLITKAVKNFDYRSLILVSTMIAGGIMTIIYLFVCNFSFNFDLPSILILLFNAALYTIAMIFWFKSLAQDDTTIVTIMLQLSPVFMLFLSPIFLSGQSLSPIQLIGSLIVMFASVLLTYEPTKKSFNKKRLHTLFIMTLASLAFAIYFILERYINQDHDFNQTILWTNISLLVVGILMFVFLKSYRQSFAKMLKTNGKKVIGLNIVNELINSFGDVLLIFTGTLTSVALASFVSQGVKPFAVMIIGIALAKLFSKSKKRTTKTEIAKRIIAILICIIGLACIEFG